MYRLMIVDDEEKIRTGIANYFPWEELGYEVAYLAENGQQAFDYLLRDPRIDAILCDIMMPVVNGLELIEMIQESGLSHIQIVILSGYQEFEYAHRALSLGIRYYLLKPTKFQELSQVFTKIKAELDAFHSSVEFQVAEDTLQEPAVVDEIKALVQTRYASITLDEIAKEVHLSPYYISKLFKNKTGQNFYEYLLQTRMKIAMNLLLHSNLKIYEISDRVGYKNHKSFLKIFKRYYPKNPIDYRKGSGE